MAGNHPAILEASHCANNGHPIGRRRPKADTPFANFRRTQARGDPKGLLQDLMLSLGGEVRGIAGFRFPGCTSYNPPVWP